MEMIVEVLARNGLVFAFLFVGGVMWLSYQLSDRLTAGRLHGSAVAIIIGLILAWIGGMMTGGSRGLADVPLFTGIGLMGGAMLRDLAIVSTAYGVDMREIRKAGAAGVSALALGIVVSFAVGAAIAAAFGYTDAVSMATIGGGAATYIVGPVTGTALGASSEVIALSVAAGLLKAVLVMIGTPLVAPLIGLNNPKSAMAYGGLMGTTSGVAGRTWPLKSRSGASKPSDAAAAATTVASARTSAMRRGARAGRWRWFMGVPPGSVDSAARPRGRGCLGASALRPNPRRGRRRGLPG